MRGRDREDKAFQKNSIADIVILVGIFLLFGLEFLLHGKVIFMMDDLWYSTNLATGQPLHGLKDVVESQVWHFMNWGGRNITHGLLQLVLMTGNHAADLINLLMTAFLGVMICRTAGVRNKIWFLLAECLLIGLNANVRMSMFWQAGAVNYVYSTVWLLFFLWIYLRQLREPEVSPLPGIAVWILPLGLAAGWSNENMGPACTLAATVITIYLIYKKKCSLKLWMAEGIATAIAGSVLVIVAPGNFVRVAAIEKMGAMESILQRLNAMLIATGDFLFPTLVLTGMTILCYACFCREKLEPVHWVLLFTAVAAHGAMALSPHYPDRATFGIMALCITVTISLLQKIWEKFVEGRKWILLFLAGSFLYAVFVLSQCLIFTDRIVGA